MSQIGTIILNTYSVQKDEVVYARAAHSINNTDVVAVRRQFGSTKRPELRTNLRFERDFSPQNAAETTKKSVTLNITATVPPGLDEAAVTSYIKEALTQSPDAMATLAKTGDVYLGA